MTIVVLSNHHAMTYKFRKEVLQAMLDEGHRVILVLRYGESVALMQSMGCEFIDVPLERHGMNPLHELGLFNAYMKILKSTKPDAVLAYTLKPNLYGGIACEILKIPYISNITGLGSAIANGGLLQKFSLFMYKLSLRKAEKVFFQNKDNMKFFVDKKIVSGEYDLLPGSGVNSEEFSFLDYPSDGVIRFAFVARITREKGIEQFLEAAKDIKNKYPDTEFHICGFCEAEYDGSLKECIDSGTVIYHGMVDDVREIYKDAHCLVNPSFHEGMSNALLEAAACGRPVIASDIPGCRETFTDGVSGLSCEVKSAESLREAMEKFILLPYDEKKQMGLAGRQKVKKEFDRTIVVEKYMDALKNIARK